MMNHYLLASIALIGLLIFLQQAALKTYTKLQKNVSSKIFSFLRENKLKSLLSFLVVLGAFMCLLGEYYEEMISIAGVILSLLSLWGLSRLFWMESNPFDLLKGYEKEAYKAMSDKNETGICEWIEGVHEIGLKALHNSGIPLVSAALESELQIGRRFLSESNSLDLPKIGYVMFFLYERLSVLFVKALHDRQDPLCTQVNTTYGKLALHAMSTHPHFAGHALSFAGKLAVTAVKAGLKEVGIKTELMLIELTKSVANDVSLDDYDLREPLLEVVQNMEEISKELYRQDKNIPIDVLKNPFLQLKTVLVDSKGSEHPTIVMIINDADRVLAQFQELELILKTIPPIQK